LEEVILYEFTLTPKRSETTDDEPTTLNSTAKAGEAQPQNKPAAALVNLSGPRVLVAFDPYDVKEGAEAEFQRGLKDTKVKVLMTYHYGFYYLLDCGDKSPEDVLKGVPFHAGAIVFRDGNFVNAIASHDGKQVPKNYAVLRWGSNLEAVQEMEKDVAKFSKMDGVVAKFHQWKRKSDRLEDQVAGNPSWMQLNPGKGKTLLEVFLLAEAQFDYSEAKVK